MQATIDKITLEHIPDGYGESEGMIGIRAKAEVSYSIGNGNRRLEWLTSGGLWGIDGDADNEEIEEVEQMQLDELKEHLEVFNIDTSNFESKIES